MEASESIWALVSGLPSGCREQREFMALQAFIDDSGSEPQSPVFVLAGPISTTANWADFSDEWAAALAKPPGVGYFKTSDAMSLRREFSQDRGWTDQLRDARVIELSHIIWRYATVAVSAQLMHKDWEETIQRLAPVAEGFPTKRLSHPYAFLWCTMLRELWLHPTKLTLINAGPCDFIFDQQMGHEEEVLGLWKTMKAIIDQPPLLPSKMRSWIGSPPIFRDEKQFLPLQAADLLAWANRRASAFKAHELKLPREAMNRLCAVPQMHLNVTRDHMISDLWKGVEAMKRYLSERL